MTRTPILIYNVIPWNDLSAKDMLTIMDAVPENVPLRDIDAFLYSACALGGHGAISALTSTLPGGSVKLFKAVAKGDHRTGRDIHFKLNALWNALRSDNLPACVKYIRARQELPMFYPRPPMECVTDQQKVQIDAFLSPLPAL